MHSSFIGILKSLCYDARSEKHKKITQNKVIMPFVYILIL